MKGIFLFRYVRALAGRDVCAAGQGAMKGKGECTALAADRRSGLLPRGPCARFHPQTANAELDRQTVAFPL